MGRRSIFRPKEGGYRVQGLITKTAGKKFEEARRRLAALAQWKVDDVSDADTTEFLARGDADTRAYLGLT